MFIFGLYEEIKMKWKTCCASIFDICNKKIIKSLLYLVLFGNCSTTNNSVSNFFLFNKIHD